MKDLTREEERLRQEISKMDALFEKKKWKRVKATFFVLSGVIYFVAFALDEMREIEDYLCWLLAAPVLAGIIVFASMLVLLYMITGGTEEAKTIARLEGKLEGIEEAKRSEKNVTELVLGKNVTNRKEV